MQHDAAQQLHRIGPLAQHAVGRLTHGGKGVGQDGVQRLASSQAALQHVGLAAQLCVGHGVILCAQPLDLIDQRLDGLQLPLGAGAEKLGGNGREQTHNRSPFGRGAPRRDHWYIFARPGRADLPETERETRYGRIIAYPGRERNTES